MSGHFIQILHTGNQHLVCLSTVRSDDGLGELYDSLYHNVIENEVVEQVKKTWLALETSLAYMSLLSNNKAIEVTVGFIP